MSHYIKYGLYSLLIVALCSCSHKKKQSYDELAPSGLTTRTEFLRTNLHTLTDKGMMIGHENGTVEGIGWRGDSARSDIQSCCDDYPAVLSFKLTGIEKGSKLNTDSLDFTTIRKAILEQFKRGGVNILTWEILSDNLNENQIKDDTRRAATYLNSLQNAYGIKAPILLSLVPATDRNGKPMEVSSQQYKNLWMKIVHMLKGYKTSNVAFVYAVSTKQASSQADINAYYPGDDCIDIFELNDMQSKSNGNIPLYKNTLQTLLQNVVTVAQSHNKLIGLRTGMQGIPAKDFWTQTLLPILKPYKITYLLLGANKGDKSMKNYDVPFPGEASVTDFVQFYNDPLTLFMSDVNGLYLDHSEKEKK